MSSSPRVKRFSRLVESRRVGNGQVVKKFLPPAPERLKIEAPALNYRRHLLHLVINVVNISAASSSHCRSPSRQISILCHQRRAAGECQCRRRRAGRGQPAPAGQPDSRLETTQSELGRPPVPAFVEQKRLKNAVAEPCRQLNV